MHARGRPGAPIPLLSQPSCAEGRRPRQAGNRADAWPVAAGDAWRATWLAASDMTDDEAPLALERRNPLWGEVSLAEQGRILRLLMDWADPELGGADERMRLGGLSRARELLCPGVEWARSAA